MAVVIGGGDGVGVIVSVVEVCGVCVSSGEVVIVEVVEEAVFVEGGTSSSLGW